MTKKSIILHAKENLNMLEAQENLYLNEDNEQSLIRLYEKMHRQLKILMRAELEEYTHCERYVRKNLVEAYIKHGTYLKSTQKDFETARACLEKALKLNRDLPIAYYRLGFLAYKRKAYAEALYYFNEAVHVNGEPKYQLPVQQQSYAQLYLANSALYVAHAANEALVQLPEQQKLASYELSPIYAQLLNQEQFLIANSFYCFSEHGVDTCSSRECEWVCETPHALILYFSDRENMCIYNGAAIGLTVNYADTLRHLLLACSVQSPGIRQQFSEFFERLDYNGEVRAEAFRQRISRLRGKLAEIGLTDVVKQTRKQGETAYYIEEIPFFVLYRVDEYTAYDYAQRL